MLLVYWTYGCSRSVRNKSAKRNNNINTRILRQTLSFTVPAANSVSKHFLSQVSNSDDTLASCPAPVASAGFWHKSEFKPAPATCANNNLISMTHLPLTGTSQLLIVTDAWKLASVSSLEEVNWCQYNIMFLLQNINISQLWSDIQMTINSKHVPVLP